MRRVIFFLLSAVLVWLIGARCRLHGPAAEAMTPAAAWDSETYNILDWDFSALPETAGSAFAAEMNSHFLSCPPTAKHSRTGLLKGRNLLLILAEGWSADDLGGGRAPALYRLWSEGVRFREVYAPDWYQGRDGREFALLTGLTPTTVHDRTSMALLAGQDIYLPFTLARCLGQAGYTCQAYGTEGPAEIYRALGFGPASAGSPAEAARELAENGPFFLYLALEDQDGEALLENLLQALEDAGVRDSTAICVSAGNAQPLRGSLFLWSPGLEGTVVPAPCSELDVTPTLLDLFGLEYDARFLSGRDVLADGAGTGGMTPLVSLYGSAYSDWVTDAGSYLAGEDAFFPADDRFTGAQEQARYVLQTRQTVYDRYVFSRRILESNYFRLLSRR